MLPSIVVDRFRLIYRPLTAQAWRAIDREIWAYRLLRRLFGRLVRRRDGIVVSQTKVHMTNKSDDIGGGLDPRPKVERVGASAAAAGGRGLDSTQSYTGGAGRKINAVNYLAVDPAERRRIRWAARALLWKASSLKSVRQCGRVLAEHDGSIATGAGVKRRILPSSSGKDGQAVAGYAGVQLCGSVWACPRCSAVIAQSRAAEIGRAVAECLANGGHVYLMTFTLRHDRSDNLKTLWDGLSAGWTAAFSSDAWRTRPTRTRVKAGRVVLEPMALGDADRFSIAGRVRCVESTVSLPETGGHGWHVHSHALVFSTSDLSNGLVADLDGELASLLERPLVHYDHAAIGRLAFSSRIFGRFARAAERHGLKAPRAEGFDMREIFDGGAEFIGAYLSKATLDVAYKIGAEVAAGNETKSSRSEINVTPFEVLRRCASDIGAKNFGIRTPRRWEAIEVDDGWGVLDLDTAEVTNITAPGLWPLWHTWEQASKGRRQIVWSRPIEGDSPRSALWNAILKARGAEALDEDLARQELFGERLGEIPRTDWYKHLVWRPTWLVGALEAAETEGIDGINQYLSDRGVRFIREGRPF